MAIIPAVLSLLLSIGTLTVFHACEIKEDGTWMHCHDAQNAVAIGGVVLTLLMSAALPFEKKMLKAVLYGLGVISSIITFLIPGSIISMCMMHTMRCYSVMQPFVRILSVLIAVCCLIRFLQTVKK